MYGTSGVVSGRGSAGRVDGLATSPAGGHLPAGWYLKGATGRGAL